MPERRLQRTREIYQPQSFVLYPWPIYVTACEPPEHYQRPESSRCFCNRYQYIAPSYVMTVDA